jgi:putative transposase
MLCGSDCNDNMLRDVTRVKRGDTVGICRQHNIAEQTLYRWRRQFGSMEVSEVKRLRALQRENAELKRLVGELTLDNRMLKEVLGKNW